MLKNTTLSVAEICYSVGVENPLYFSRIYKSYYGTPAMGGAGTVMAEATAVSPEGRIGAHDLWLNAFSDSDYFR